MEEKQVRTLNIKGLPKEAVGVHKVKKVMLFGERTGQTSYAYVLLDNLVSFRIDQKYFGIAGPGTVCRCFSNDEYLLLMSEGRTFNFASF